VLNVGLTVPVCNLLAYLLGPIALTQPHWVAVSLTVTAVLLLTGRERLHTMARQLELPEIVTAGKFLILTGIILPLLPNEQITPLTRVTPYQAWLALVAVCTLSYGSYLLQRYWAANRSAFVTAILGGLYSSTATTVVLARRASTGEIPLARAQVGIALATAVMYLRILVIIAVFNWSLAVSLAPSLLALSLLGFALAGLHDWCAGRPAAQTSVRVEPSNPLELSAAALFAVLFVAISIASTWAADHFGAAGLYVIAAIVGVTDIDPFVLSIAQGGASSLTGADAAHCDRHKQSLEGSLHRRFHRAPQGFAGRWHTRPALRCCGVVRISVNPALTDAPDLVLAGTRRPSEGRPNAAWLPYRGYPYPYPYPYGCGWGGW
jgi:uncharacterized membrane protein (DUF4010 family)